MSLAQPSTFRRSTGSAPLASSPHLLLLLRPCADENVPPEPLQATATEIEVMDPDVSSVVCRTPRVKAHFLRPQQRSKLALKLKASGNKAYSGKRFAEAIEHYTKAIDFEEQAVYYSNRAACASFFLSPSMGALS